MSGMNDTPETLPRRRRTSRKRGAPAAAPPEPAVQAILDQALHPDPAVVADAAVAAGIGEAVDADAATARPAPRRRAPRKRKGAQTAVQPPVEAVAAVDAPGEGATEDVADVRGVEAPAMPADASDPSGDASVDDPVGNTDAPESRDEADPSSGPEVVPDPPGHAGPTHAGPAHDAPPPAGGGHGAHAAHHGSGHYWVYVAFAVFLLALGFGGWGVWTTFFAADDDGGRSVAALRTRADRLRQEVSTLRRSDQISREANRDLERTLAERDEEIAGLRADIAFYESFVGATGQRRGLSVHDLQMQLQSGDAWHFVATLTQNLNRGAINSGRLTLSIEGTRNDRLERLAWSSLRKLNNAPGVDYSFKYFQQVEGEVILPPGFKPLRVTVRLVPAGGSAVEQSFPWPDAIRPHSAAAR